MRLGRKLKKYYKRFEGAVKDAADNPYVKAGAMTFANPLAAQDLFGAQFANSGDFHGSVVGMTEDPSKYSSKDWQDLGAFNAALVAGAVTGGLATAGTPFAASLGLGMAPGSAAFLGAGVGAGTLALANTGTAAYRAYKKEEDVDVSAPPDVNAANDPRLAEQFKRQRRAARMLGRAGTIKSKGVSSSLGLGDSILGDSMSLMGA